MRGKPWKPHGIMSIQGWGRVGYLMPSGKYVPEGESKQRAWPTHLMSSGDTLYVVPPEAIKLGREYQIA